MEPEGWGWGLKAIFKGQMGGIGSKEVQDTVEKQSRGGQGVGGGSGEQEKIVPVKPRTENFMRKEKNSQVNQMQQKV